MDATLSAMEVRVLGCLIEKAMSTPEYYPMTLNALTAACNQKSNRDPVMQMTGEDTVRALDALRERRLAWSVALAGSRTPKYRHSIEDLYPLLPPQQAVLCELMVRGPQTVGELRTHAGRLWALTDTAEVQTILQQLMAWEGGPLAAVAPRRSGQREERYGQLLGGSLAGEAGIVGPGVEPDRLSVMAGNERIAALEAKVALLEDEVARLKAQFSDFSKQFQ
jgi:uncharacterized protein YceH (UPF0502 family)